MKNLAIEYYSGFFAVRIEKDLLGFYTSVIDAAADVAKTLQAMEFTEVSLSNKLLEKFINLNLEKIAKKTK